MIICALIHAQILFVYMNRKKTVFRSNQILTSIYSDIHPNTIIIASVIKKMLIQPILFMADQAVNQWEMRLHT